MIRAREIAFRQQTESARDYSDPPDVSTPPSKKENDNLDHSLETTQQNQLSELVSDDELLSAYEPHIRTVVASMVRKSGGRLTREDGEEIAQAARIALVSAPGSYGTWPLLCRTVVNNAARTARKQILAYRSRHVSADAGWEQGFSPLASLISHDPSTTSDTAQTAAKLWSALSQRQQSILAMHLGLRGPRLGTRQISHAMETPERRIKHEIRIAMQILRDLAATK